MSDLVPASPSAPAAPAPGSQAEAPGSEPAGTAAPPGLSPLAAVLEVAVASGFPSQFALGALLTAAGLMPFDSAGRLSMTYLALLMPADTVLLLAFVVWRLRAGGDGVVEVLLGRRSWTRECWIGVGLIPLVFGGVVIVMAALRAAWPALHNVEANPFESLITTRAGALQLAVLVIITGGVKEEVQRAFVLHRFDQRLGGARLGLVLYSLVFGMGHVIQGYDVGIVTVLLGIAWGTVILWRRSLIASSVSHAGFNGAQVLQFVVFGG